VFVLLSLVALFARNCLATLNVHADSGIASVPNEALVKVLPGRAAPAGADPRPILSTPSGDWYVVRSATKSTEQLVTEAAQDNSVVAAEPNKIMTALDGPMIGDAFLPPATTPADPNDPLYPQQYSLPMMLVPSAWRTTDGADATVYVLDTGADFGHEDLVVRPGPDFADGRSAPDDVQGHGTHVAGIVGATRDNGKGVAGVARAKLVAVRVLGDGGSGSMSGVAQGMRWAADQPGTHKIVSMSLGAAGDSQIMADAVEYLHARNTLVIAAAGNASTDQPYAPAKYADLGVIAVGSDSRIAGFSNFGQNGNISAPGVNVLSTVMKVGTGIHDPSGYTTLSGTSMATPNVAGVAALVWSANPDFTAQDVRSAILGSASPAPGDSYHYGAGIVNAFGAVNGKPGPVPTPNPTTAPPPVPTSTPNDFNDRLLQLLNEQRVKYGLRPLALSVALQNAAHQHNVAMNACAAAKGINSCFSHQLPGEDDPITRMHKAGWPYSGAENIGYGYTTPEAMVDGWMNSSGHRANILNASATAFGPAFLDGTGTGAWQGFFWTLAIGIGSGPVPTPTVTPAPPQPTPQPGWNHPKYPAVFRMMNLPVTPQNKAILKDWAFTFDPTHNAASPGFLFKDAYGNMTPGNVAEGAATVDVMNGTLWTQSLDAKLTALENASNRKAEFGDITWR